VAGIASLSIPGSALFLRVWRNGVCGGGIGRKESAVLSKDVLYFLQQCLNAVQVSSFYCLLAVAYVLLYGITNRINLAFGAIAVWASYLAIGSVAVLSALTPLVMAAVVLLAIVHSLASTMLLGLVIERLVLRPLVQRVSLAMLIATIGLAIMLEEIMRLTQGNRDRWLSPLLGEPIELARGDDFSVEITQMRVIIIIAALLLSAALILFMAKHRFGRQWRACAQDLQMAALCGVDIRSTLTLTAIIAAGYAAAAGTAIVLYYGNASFFIGITIALKALLVAVIGGLSSIPGVLAGGFLLGFLESFWSAYFPANYRDVVTFAALIVMLIFRPQGLFAASMRADHDRY